MSGAAFLQSAAGLAATIPAPSVRELELGPLNIRLYALCLLAGIAVGAAIGYRRWRARDGDPDLFLEATLVAVAFGIVGGRLYHVVTSWDQVTKEWWGPFAIWEGGLGIWGAIALGGVVSGWYVHRRGGSVADLADAVAPGLLVGQAIGRLGNYFNQELFGGPTDLPWGLAVDAARRPAELAASTAFHPTFLYEMLWNLGLAGLLILLGSRYRIRPPGLFALYVAGYSLGRIWWEQLRVDPSEEFLGQRLNFYVALALFVGGLVVFWWTQRRGESGDRAPAGSARSGPPVRSKVSAARAVPRQAAPRRRRRS